MAEERFTKEILLGTGGIGTLLLGIAAVAALMNPGQPSPPTGTPVVLSTAPPEPTDAPTAEVTLRPASTPPETPQPTTIPSLVATAPATVAVGVNWQVVLAPGPQEGLVAARATIVIDGSVAGRLHVSASQPVSALELSASPGIHTYEVHLVKGMDLGLGYQEFNLSGAGEIHVAAGSRLAVVDDGFTAALVPA